MKNIKETLDSAVDYTLTVEFEKKSTNVIKGFFKIVFGYLFIQIMLGIIF